MSATVRMPAAKREARRKTNRPLDTRILPVLSSDHRSIGKKGRITLPNFSYWKLCVPDFLLFAMRFFF